VLIFDVLGYCMRFVSCFSLLTSTVLGVVFFEYGTWYDVLTEAYDSTWYDVLTEAYDSTKDIALCL
jgi:hypothetical protein